MLDCVCMYYVREKWVCTYRNVGGKSFTVRGDYCTLGETYNSQIGKEVFIQMAKTVRKHNVCALLLSSQSHFSFDIRSEMVTLYYPMDEEIDMYGESREKANQEIVSLILFMAGRQTERNIWLMYDLYIRLFRLGGVHEGKKCAFSTREKRERCLVARVREQTLGMSK